MPVVVWVITSGEMRIAFALFVAAGISDAVISAFLLAWLVGRPMPVRPLLVSKFNTVAQILLAALVLGEHAFGFDAVIATDLTMALVAVLTLLSIAFYLAEWIRHMNSFGAGH